MMVTSQSRTQLYGTGQNEGVSTEVRRRQLLAVEYYLIAFSAASEWTQEMSAPSGAKTDGKPHLVLIRFLESSN